MNRLEDESDFEEREGEDSALIWRIHDPCFRHPFHLEVRESSEPLPPSLVTEDAAYNVACLLADLSKNLLIWPLGSFSCS